MIYNIIFRFCRFWVRIFIGRYQVCDVNNLNSSVVYIVHHQNLRGPIIAMAWLKKAIRPWVLSIFCNQKACFDQYYDYTFTKRFAIPKMISAVIAFLLSFCVPLLMKSIRAIPVFRDSKRIIKTFRQSVSALINGENLLICPDLDYTDTSSNMGEMYKGFLSLDKYYIRKTGKHLAFIPLHISKRKKSIYAGEAIYFDAYSDYKQNKLEVYKRLKQEFLRLEKNK